MPKYSLRLGGYQPEGSVHTRALHHLAGLLLKRSGLMFQPAININATAQGDRAADLLTMVETGRLDGCYFASLAHERVAVVPPEEIDFAAFRAAVEPVVQREIARLGG